MNTVKFRLSSCQPFDVVSGFGNKETLRVAIDLDVRTAGVDGNGTRTVFLRANFQRD